MCGEKRVSQILRASQAASSVSVMASPAFWNDPRSDSRPWRVVVRARIRPHHAHCSCHVLVLLAGAPMAANWPQWRGPSGLGVSAESGLPTTWSARENIAWSVALRGLGSSSPIVWGDQIFVTSQVGRVPLGGGRASGAGPRRRRVGRRARNLIGGRRDEPSDRGRSDLSSSSSPSTDPTAVASGNTASRRGARSPVSTKSTTWQRRRLSPTASTSSPGSAPVSSWRSTCAVASCGRSTSEKSTRRSTSTGDTAALLCSTRTC